MMLASSLAAFGQGSSDLAQGIQLLRQGHAVEAQASFDRAVQAEPGSAEVHLWRGVCENQVGQYLQAAIDLREAIVIQPQMVSARYNLALSLIRLHQVDEAIDQLRLVIAAQPEATQPLYNLAILLEAKQQYGEAAKYLANIHHVTPADAGVTLHLLQDSAKTQDAATIEGLVEELATETTPQPLQQQAGAALLEGGRFADAVHLLTIAKQRNNTAPGLDPLLARALIGNHQSSSAVTLLKQDGREKSDAETSYLLGLAYLDTGSVTEAKARFQQAVTLDPADPGPRYQLGLLLVSEPPQREEGIRLLQEANRLEPASPVYAGALARVLLATDQAEQAKVVLAAVPAGNRDAETHTLLGIALVATHETPAATKELTLAIAEAPQLALAQNILGFCLFQQGQYAQAAQAYAKAAESDPRRLLYAEDAALASQRADNTAQALHFAQQAASLGDDSAGNHMLLGKLYASTDRKPEAIRELQRAVDLDPDLDAPVYLLARTYQQMGERQKAVEWTNRLAVIKQKHEADFARKKQALSAPVPSSTLLKGGSMSYDRVEEQ
jgi:tetratricopeptide (TPR) repeat protein